jgi:murein DD-endopeptidase MepM/ murein hydrolase activator NlpD
MKIPRSFRIIIITSAIVIIIYILFALGCSINERKYGISSPIIHGKVRVDSLSFWYSPWGESPMHKGIDMFTNKGNSIHSVKNGIVLDCGYGTIAGNYAYILSFDFKIYYYAHMEVCYIRRYQTVKKLQLIGLVGDSGNANGKPPHLHFSIFSIFPIIQKFDNDAIFGWKKMFYLNPDKYIKRQLDCSLK